ncbi:MAG: T9SS type A sorting domain-containing protein [Chitinophagaceae bacterium]|nr:T9SS type A sorting domain-containing protein [Chitinophagaceae bacterium]
MNYRFFHIRAVLCFLLAMYSGVPISAQVATALPQGVLRPIGLNFVSTALSGDIVSPGSGNTDYQWTVSPSTGVILSHPDHSLATANATFTAAATGVYVFSLRRGPLSAEVSVTVGNLVAASNTGLEISIFNVANGSLVTGPGPEVAFDPFTDATTTAGLGVAQNGFYYYMPNVFNNGTVTLYAASRNGQATIPVATTDLNGGSNNNLGFVRLAIDATGKGWMLAGDGFSLYLASFEANGLNATSIQLVDDNVTLAGGNPSVFQNGDLCFSGTGALFALANDGGGVTQIFTGYPNGGSTTLTRKWDLVDALGNNFTGNVNGVAFDPTGSLYISTGGPAGGLFFIDQNTVNTGTGTVQCTLVWSGTGLTDLASNNFPAETILPAKLLSFTAQYRNSKTTLRWTTEAEQNLSHFEIERSANSTDYGLIGTTTATAVAGNRQDYQLIDDLAAVNGNTFTYRLKLTDHDGKFKYSHVLMVRKESSKISGIVVNPNPVTEGAATLRFTSEMATDIAINITDLAGRSISRRQVRVVEGVNSISLLGLDWTRTGIYVVHVKNNDELHLFKILVTRGK